MCSHVVKVTNTKSKEIKKKQAKIEENRLHELILKKTSN